MNRTYCRQLWVYPETDRHRLLFFWLVTGQRSNQLNYVPNRGINDLP